MYSSYILIVDLIWFSNFPSYDQSHWSNTQFLSKYNIWKYCQPDMNDIIDRKLQDSCKYWCIPQRIVSLIAAILLDVCAWTHNCFPTLTLGSLSNQTRMCKVNAISLLLPIIAYNWCMSISHLLYRWWIVLNCNQSSL